MFEIGVRLGVRVGSGAEIMILIWLLVLYYGYNITRAAAGAMPGAITRVRVSTSAGMMWFIVTGRVPSKAWPGSRPGPEPGAGSRLFK